MHIIDLSREIHHRAPAHPNHPPVIITVWNDHSEVKRAGNTEFTSKSLSITMSDHSCTHVDAPVHFNPAPDAPSIDEVPLENFYTEAICLDFGDLPNNYEATVEDMEAALAASGEEIKPGDTVMIHMGIHNRLFGTPEYVHDFPGLSVAAVHWLADRKITMFGVETVSPAPEGEPNYLAHLACAVF